MTTMIDRFHDAYHAQAPDYDCPHCQDELIRCDSYRTVAQHEERENLTLDSYRRSDSLPLPVVEIDAEVEWGAWLEATYDPDVSPVDRLEDLD